MKYIPIYINSLFRIILKKGINEETKTEIVRICKKKLKQQAELDEVKDIQADTEKTFKVKEIQRDGTGISLIHLQLQ